MTTHQAIAPIVKTVTVPATPTRAFEAFTVEMTTWWPLATHSVGEADARELRLEAGLGGQIVEYGADGPIAVWGTITDWDPPTEIGFTWHPGRAPAEATQVTVRFSPVEGGTAVELTHTGWERRPDATEARRSYDSGWNPVLARFAAGLS